MSQARINTPEDWREKLVIAKEQYNQMKNLAYCKGKTRGKHMHINYSQRRLFKKNYNSVIYWEYSFLSLQKI